MPAERCVETFSERVREIQGIQWQPLLARDALVGQHAAHDRPHEFLERPPQQREIIQAGSARKLRGAKALHLGCHSGQLRGEHPFAGRRLHE